MSAPLVSIVIPCYNQGKFVKRTIASVLQNKYRPIEILVIDDGSKDDSAAIVQAMQQRFPEVKLLQKENGGVSSARNHGIRNAQSEYIAFLDADDLFYPDSLAQRMQIFIEEDEPDLVGVYCPILVVDEKGNPLMNRPLFKPALAMDRFYYSTSYHIPCIPSCAIIKKSKMLECGLFDETICPAEDFDLWRKLLLQGGYLRMARTALVGWVQHEGSASHQQVLHHHNQIKRVITRVFEPHAESPIEDYREGYGKAYYIGAVSDLACYQALLAVVSHRMEAAIEITKDISFFFLQKLGPKYFENNIRICACRTLCKSETVWVTEIWPKIKDSVCEYFEYLERLHDTKFPWLMEIFAALQMSAEL